MQAERLLPKRSNGFYHTILHVKKEKQAKTTLHISLQ